MTPKSILEGSATFDEAHGFLNSIIKKGFINTRGNFSPYRDDFIIFMPGACNMKFLEIKNEQSGKTIREFISESFPKCVIQNIGTLIKFINAGTSLVELTDWEMENGEVIIKIGRDFCPYIRYTF